MSDEPEIERCVCGREAYLFQGPNDSRCACEVAECWKGPVHATTLAAITAWNTLMRAAKERARLQAEVYKAHETYRAHCTCPDCTEHRARVKETTT